MSASAKFERAFGSFSLVSLAIVSFVGCSGGSKVYPDESKNALIAPASDAVAKNDVVAPQLTSKTLANQTAKNLGIEFGSSTDLNQITVTTDSKVSDYKLTELSSPDRLVLDLIGSGSTLKGDYSTEPGALVSKVRVGSHPDKSRIVLDLTEKTAHDVKREGDKIIVTVSRPGVDIAKISNEATAKKDTALNTITPNIETVAAKDPDSRPMLRALKIESLGADGNALVVDMASQGTFELSKTAPSEYVLKLEGAGVKPNTIQTVLAPPQSGKIRSARPVAQGNDVLVRIFASPEATLAANVRGGKIMVTSKAAVDELDARAQFAPPKDASAKDAPAEKTADIVVPAKNTGDDKGKKDAGKDVVKVEDKTSGAPVDSEVSALLSDAPKYTGRLISLDLQDTDIDNALRIIAEVSNLNIISSDKVSGKVTLRLIDVPWDQALDVILKTNHLDKVQEGNVVRIAPVDDLKTEREALKQAQQAEEELEPLQVRYIRISYAKASELKTLVETVLTERGSVSYDERSNQLIVKDISKGVKNVAELVGKLDLRTPQVLLETQIVEAQRNLVRELGSELGFKTVQSPATGNATGYTFPNSITMNGSVDASSPNTGSSFPSSGDLKGGSAISLLLGSADGTRTLDARISALEKEGRVRIVSRPSVATTNNHKAQIKSVEKIRVKVPSGGLNVATGSGASASGSGTTATEVIEIGIVLDVTPQASPDYYVLLDINAKSSTFGSHQVDSIPSEVERSANSTVLVSSGQSFALGGIYKITDNDLIEGVPFFKDIPVFGHLFRRSKIDDSDEELIFFITPRIIEGSFDDAAMKVASY